MADTAITAKIHQPFDAHRGFAPEVALDSEIRDSRSKIGNFGLRQILHCDFRFNAGRSTDLPRSRGANAKDRRQPNHDVLVQWNVYACYASHFYTLPSFLSPAAAYGVCQYKSPEQRLCAELSCSFCTFF